MIEPGLARKMHRTLEPFHAVVYFAPEAFAAYAALGARHLRGVGAGELDYDVGYFGSRAAAMGPVPAEVVVATFFNFNPEVVHRAIPLAWEVASPEAWVEARRDAVREALQRTLGDLADGPEVREAAPLAQQACEALPVAGRPLFAGHRSLPWPDDPLVSLWHSITLLREYRGDGHIACLVRAGVDPCEALVLQGPFGGMPTSVLKSTRRWDELEWAGAVARLEARGWVHTDGSLTETGRVAREAIEAETDAVDLAAWQAIGPDGSGRLRELVRPLSKAIVASGAFGAAS